MHRGLSGCGLDSTCAADSRLRLSDEERGRQDGGHGESPPSGCANLTPAFSLSSAYRATGVVRSVGQDAFVGVLKLLLSLSAQRGCSPVVFVAICPSMCFARCPNPRAGREKASKTMQLAKKGKFITDSNQGSCRASNTVVRGQRALSRGGYPNL